MMWWLDAYDLIAGAWIGAYLTHTYYKPVLPIKVTTLPPDAPKPEYREWRNTMQPIISKFVVAGALGGTTTFNATGSRALGKMIEDMAVKLDRACDNDLATPPTVKIKVQTVRPE